MPLLLEQGAVLTCYDPVGAEKFRQRYPALSYASSAEEALRGANACFIFTEWPEIRAVAPEAFRANMRTPLVYDGRNLFSPEAMHEAGVEYYSIGRP